MAESTVKALERQLDSLQRLYATLDTKGFPNAMLIYGKETPQAVRAEIERQLGAYGLRLEDVEHLGLMDQIRICSLPWLKSRHITARLQPLPDIGSDQSGLIKPIMTIG